MARSSFARRHDKPKRAGQQEEIAAAAPFRLYCEFRQAPTEQDGLYFGFPCMTVPPFLQQVTNPGLPASVPRPRRAPLVQLQCWLAVTLLWLLLMPAARAALDVDVEIPGVD